MIQIHGLIRHALEITVCVCVCGPVHTLRSSNRWLFLGTDHTSQRTRSITDRRQNYVYEGKGNCHNRSAENFLTIVNERTVQ